ncbi:hypothetical protein EAG_08559, partial [Camponotus floridanus]
LFILGFNDEKCHQCVIFKIFVTVSLQTIRCTPGIFERVRESMRRRVPAIQENGEHFQHLL